MLTRILAILAGVLLCASARAVDIPSDASGDYNGGGYACRIVAQNFAVLGGTQRGIGVQCLEPDGDQTVAIITGPGCPNDAYLIPLTRWGSAGAYAPGTDWLRIVAIGTGTITVRIGSRDALIAGGGVSWLMNRAQVINPASAYSGCGGTLQPAVPVRSCPVWLWPYC